MKGNKEAVSAPFLSFPAPSAMETSTVARALLGLSAALVARNTKRVSASLQRQSTFHSHAPAPSHSSE